MFCTYLKNVLVDHILMKDTYTSAAPPVVCLWIGNPGASLIDGSECSGGGYVRQATLTSEWDQIGGTADNNTEIAFPEATGYWGIVTHVAITDHISPGSQLALFYGPLTSPKEIDEGSVAKFRIGALSIILL